MLKVIIADDEERVCRLVQMIVDWDKLGMTVTGIASNGLEALELIENLKPDILITDIRMPGCDGLELIERARAISPNLQIVLISGYANFEYAKTALDFDVGGYILKPIKKEAITSVLLKLGERCKEHAATITTANKLLQDSHKSSKLLRGRLLEDLLLRRIHEPSDELLESRYGFLPMDGLLQVFIIKADCSFNQVREPSMEIVKKKIEEVSESAISVLCETYEFMFTISAGYGILNYKPGQQSKIRRALRECLNQLEAHRFGGMEFSLSIGNAVDCAAKLPESMQNAQIAIAERIVEGTGRMFEADSIDRQHDSRKLIEKYAKHIERVAELLNEEEVDSVINEIQKEIQNAQLSGYALLDFVLATGKIFTMRLHMDENSVLHSGFEERCQMCSSVGKLLECLRDYMKEQIVTVRGRFEKEAIRPVRLAQQYVMQHYNEPITLEEVCEVVGFSVSYFSKLFKKETGEGFSRYITQVRIDRAKEILRETNLPVTEVCEMVGYSDIKHFTGTFKKITNLNPGQYRKLYG